MAAINASRPSLEVYLHTLKSSFLKRTVTIEIYQPQTEFVTPRDLLIINDGQDLGRMNFSDIFSSLVSRGEIKPLICIGIHCGPERKMEYGMKDQPDFKGRGAKSGLYERFLFEECLPFLYSRCGISADMQLHYAGFSLGALSALDMAWRYNDIFEKVGIFSGSLWWRDKDYQDGYNDDTDRLVHAMIRRGPLKENLKFFIQCGAADESEDRNNNGIIDSIDDALDLVKELKTVGYSDEAIKYVEIADGKHDVPTWGRAFPDFFKWGWATE
jgi:enterochelin esterase-like enzyme